MKKQRKYLVRLFREYIGRPNTTRWCNGMYRTAEKVGKVNPLSRECYSFSPPGASLNVIIETDETAEELERRIESSTYFIVRSVTNW
jgi:hypothetical protein